MLFFDVYCFQYLEHNKIMFSRFNTILIAVFFSLSINANSGELYVGSEHQGSLYDLYGMKINLVLPNGTWQVAENEKSTFSDLDYQEIALERVSGEYGWLYIYLPTKKSTGGMRWRGSLKKCDGRDNKNIIASGVERGGVEAVLCLSKYVYDGGEYADDINMYIEVAISNGPLAYMVYNYYADYQSFNFDLDKNQRKQLIKDVIQGIKKGIKGGDASSMNSMHSLFND